MGEVPTVVIASRGSLGRPESEHIVLGAFEGEPPALEGLAEGVRGAVERLASRPGWKGREDQTVQTDLGGGGEGGGGAVVSLLGLGKRNDFSAVKLAQWIGRAHEHARVHGARRMALALPEHSETAGFDAAERALRLAALAGYRFDRYLEEKEEKKTRVERIDVAPPAGEEESYRAALAVALPIAEAVSFARDLANSPPNEATPAWMEDRAREVAESRGVAFEVLGVDELRARGMGGILAVGSGSAVPPRLLRLEWSPEGEVRGTVALVGKGVTFDTGGISIKPAANMEEMKYDKSGACAVLAIVRAAAELRLPVRVRGYIALAENMPSGTAYRPGDILRFYNGKTVEITNTDAEGRLILADALALAAEEQPDALLEYSTLTGAIVVALGHQAAGLFTPDDGLAAEVAAAGDAAGERIWRMPLYPEYLEDMKGLHADLKNSAGRAGSSSTAAAFLSQFVGDLKSWGHLDIAGVANLPQTQNSRAGATGFGVASTVAWLRRRAGVA
jgi:leucyl aminopeptidase